ncbi:outer membrane lipoprotein-sorting protein [Teredinibacter sp. KSP-S5-2]|uniref:outer membrane lipoprotein-sorting protein n=1 Tax=Teredinibacter sp. KSP-S5-2 TaxID=3034506 RepID=UPI00293474E5|nr:outer membrane lipoprotein-sorting protein [Teredinibacter sp. KSP-S5-2]WNO08487.1 outer membrane lipoprotein-sorting protein [Teredinibacter sp. KSP-S5-2]
MFSCKKASCNIAAFAFVGVALFLVFLLSNKTTAAELTADQIVEKANLASYYAGADGRSQARMKIVDSQGRSQLRQFTILRKDIEDAGKQDFLVVFSRPADVRGTVFLVKKNPADDDNRWLYLPGLDLVKRISAGDKRTSFVGSHYFYEDVSGRAPIQDNHELVRQDDSHYYLKHTPKDKNSVEFSYYETAIDKSTFLPMKIDYFDENKKPIRSVEVDTVETVKGYPTVTQSKITDHKSGGYTLMQFRFMDYDLGIEESIFSERSLRNPPQKWLE